MEAVLHIEAFVEDNYFVFRRSFGEGEKPSQISSKPKFGEPIIKTELKDPSAKLHPDLVALGCLVSSMPFAGETIELSFEVSEKFATTVFDHFGKKSGPFPTLFGLGHYQSTVAQAYPSVAALILVWRSRYFPQTQCPYS